MSAINFVVRDVAGNISRGSVAGEGVPSSVVVGAGADVSLNVTRGQIISYTRQGQALEITLIDGRVITIEGFFTMEGVSENQLFLSADGYLAEVQLTEGAGADYYASYSQDDGVGKFALNDDLYFMRGADVMLAEAYVPADDEVGMLGAFAAPLFGWGGAAAAAGAAALIGSGGGAGAGGASDGDGGGDGGGPSAPVVDITSGVEGDDHIVNEEDHSDGVDIGGTGTPGGTVDVVVSGTTETTTVDEDGNWTVTFDSDDIDAGEYETPIEVTITNEGGSTTVTDTLVVDTIIGAEMDTAGGEDAVVNATEYGDGVTLTGTVTGSGTVVVTIDGQDYDATVDAEAGTWSLDVPTSVMGQGEYTQEVVISTTDPAGNSYSTTGTVVVDTLIGVSYSSVGGSDGVINASEFGSGVTLSGTVTGNDAVVVTINGQDYDAVVSYDEVTSQGTWTLAVPTAIMGQGEYTQAVTVNTTDQAGNSDSANMTVEVDTLIGVSANATGGTDGVINTSEFGSGVVLSGTVTGNDAVVLTIDGQNYNAVVSYNEATNQGTWTLAVPTAVMGAGEYTKDVTVSTVDAAGNSDSTQMTVEVDTLIGVDGNTLGGEDSVVNHDEFGEGIVLSGTVTGSDSVIVTIDNRNFEADVVYNEGTNEGTWSLAVPTSVMGEGEYTKEVTVTTSDAAGNTDTATVMVEVDTFVNELTTTPVVSGDDLVNGAEAADGLNLSGTVEANSEVSITFAYPGGEIVRDAQTDGNGNWTITYAPGEVPEGDYTANITINATDEHGNTHSITDSFAVDTVAPEVPGVEGVFMTPSGAGAVQIETPEQDVTIHEVTSSHQVNDVAAQVEGDPAQQDGIALGPDSMYFSFDEDLPNGSHLVVNEIDTSDNANATMVVLEETATNAVDLGGLEGFNIGAIDLGYAQDAELTLDLATLEGLSDNDNNLIIHGSDADSDTVTLIGSGDSVRTESIDGKSYDVYTMGDDAEIFIEEGVNVIY